MTDSAKAIPAKPKVALAKKPLQSLKGGTAGGTASTADKSKQQPVQIAQAQAAATASGVQAQAAASSYAADGWANGGANADFAAKFSSLPMPSVGEMFRMAAPRPKAERVDDGVGAGLAAYRTQKTNAATTPVGIAVASGPGGMAFDQAEVDAIAKGVGANGQLGDAHEAITPSQIGDAMLPALKAKQQPALFLQAHGMMDGGQHKVELGDSQWVPTKEVFSEIAKRADGKPVEIFMTSCYGSGALDDALSTLPKGSVLTTIAPNSLSASGHDVERFTGSLSAGVDLSKPNELLYRYLTKGLETRTTPGIAVSGYGAMDLNGAFIRNLGRPMSPEQQALVHDRLDGLVGAARVDDVLGKLTAAKSEWDVGAVDYGTALAASLAAMGG